MYKKIIISIPAKNEEKTLRDVILHTKAEAQKFAEQVKVLVVDDGSTDSTKNIAHEENATVISHKKSQGLGASFGEAVEFALSENADILLTVDADNQFDSKDIPALFNPIQKNLADFVTGSRFIKDAKVEGIPPSKKIGNKLMSHLISSILKQSYKDVSCGFRAYNHEALLHLNVFGKFTYTQEVFINLGVKGLRIVEVPISVKYYKDRTSRIASSLIRYGLQTSRIIVSSVIHYKPMRIFGTFSFFTFVLGLPPVVVLGVRYILTDMITPFKGIAISGIVLLVVSFASITAGITLEILSRIQLTIEKQIYYARKSSTK